MAAEESAGKVYVEAELRDKDVQSGLTRMQKGFNAFAGTAAVAGASITAAGTAIRVAIKKIIDDFTELNTTLHRTSIATGIAAEDLDQFNFVAEALGVNVDSFTDGIITLNRRLLGVGTSASYARHSLAEMGIAVEDFQRMNPSQQMQAVASGLQNIGTMQGQMLAIQRTLGLTGEQAVILARRAADVNEQFERYNALGFDTSDQTAEAEQYAQATAEMERGIRQVTDAIAEALLPSMIEFTENLVPIIVATAEWIEENQTLVRWVSFLGTVLVGLGTALVTLAGILKALAVAAGVAIPIFTAMWAALTGPIGPIIIGITAIVTALGALWFFAGRESRKELKETERTAKASMAAIRRARAAGAEAPAVPGAPREGGGRTAALSRGVVEERTARGRFGGFGTAAFLRGGSGGANLEALYRETQQGNDNIVQAIQAQQQQQAEDAERVRVELRRLPGNPAFE